MKLSVLLWTTAFLVGNAGAQGAAAPAPAAPSSPVIVAPSGAQTMLYPIDLPAGINLISVPLDAGSGPAVDAFEGIGEDWPLLFEWDSSTQSWRDPEDSMLAPGAGFWYYTPAPTTLLVRGAPYRPLKSLTKDIGVGWHLFGVPFTEGIEWNDFRLYASGSPVGIETARKLGWVSTDVLTMRGSTWQVHQPGTPFEPGAAYWVSTTVPLAVRAERSATPGIAGPTAGVLAGAAPGASPVVVTGWITETAEACKSMIEAATLVASGHFVSGGLTALGAAFGLAHYGLETTNDELMEQLQEMDAKLDTLITDVTAIQGQLGVVLGELDGLDDYMTTNDRLLNPINSAKAWVDEYYINPNKPEQSRNWARWAMAGCDPGTQSTCTNEVTQQSYDAFALNYVKHQGQTTNVTDDFFLYWAYAVIGNQQAGVDPYIKGGDKADGHVTSLYLGLADKMGTTQNGLLTYMNYVYSQSSCAADVANCDLYSEVYLPVEAVFQEAVGYQAMLVEAMLEAYSVLASIDQGSHGNDMRTYMAGFNAQLAAEAEAFLQVAEQIALYRAADGRWDWSNFAATDAGQLLARADWIAARVAGPTGASCDGCPTPASPPWPESGVVGRIIYANGEPLATAPRQLCPTSGTCTTLAEVTGTARAVDGKWPYLQWHAESDVAVGQPTTMWSIKRLVPQALADGPYKVTSNVPKRGTSNLVVAQYDLSYHNPPDDPATAQSFGSFVGLEGNLGVWALTPGVATWKPSGAGNNAGHAFTVTVGETSFKTYVAYGQVSNLDIATLTGEDYAKVKVKIVDSTPSLLSAYPRVRVYWPMTIDVNAFAWPIVNCYSATQDGYWNALWHEAKLLDSSSNTVAGATQKVQACGAAHFDSCDYTSTNRLNPGALNSDPLTLNRGAVYTLQGHFYDLLHVTYRPSNYCWWAKAGSGYSSWERHNPTFYIMR